MTKETEQGQISPLSGTEKVFFNNHQEELRIGYQAEMQQLVAKWEESSPAVAALTRKRYKTVSFVTFYGSIHLRCKEGKDSDEHWICPALSYLGLRPNQRYSPDMERRIAVLATETLSYEKASTVGEKAAWITISDCTVQATISRLGDIAEKTLPEEQCAGAAGCEDTLIVMADG